MQLQASLSFFLILIFCHGLCSEERKGPEFLPPVCTLPMDAGQCYARFVRWYHNLKTGRCEWFHYKGCRGNENNFLTKHQCQITCIDI